MNETIESTRRLEPALRYLSTHPDAKVKAVAVQFKANPTTLWAWLGAHNQGRPHPPKHIIDNCLVAPDPVKKPASTVMVRRPIASAPIAKKISGPDEKLLLWLEGQRVQIKGGANTFLVEVTPPLAASWMTLNMANRKPSKAKIRRFAAAIKEGRWSINGETVKFSATGRLIDGQSRLMACQLAAVPVVLEVRGGLPDVAQQSMDSGEIRTGAHTLEMLGEKYPQILAPAVKLVWQLERGSIQSSSSSQSGSRIKLENGELAPLVERHLGLKASVGWVMTKGAKLDRMIQPSTAAFFHYLFGRADPKRRDAFFVALTEGLGLTKVSPIYHLREQLLSDRAEKVHRVRKLAQLGLFVKAWNAYVHNQRTPALVFDSGEKIPVIAGLLLPAIAA